MEEAGLQAAPEEGRNPRLYEFVLGVWFLFKLRFEGVLTLMMWFCKHGLQASQIRSKPHCLSLQIKSKRKRPQAPFRTGFSGCCEAAWEYSSSRRSCSFLEKVRFQPGLFRKVVLDKEGHRRGSIDVYRCSHLSFSSQPSSRLPLLSRLYI